MGRHVREVTAFELTDRLPVDIPKLTLGYEVAKWIQTYIRQPDGDNAGEPYKLTREQMRFLLFFYAVDKRGKWIYDHGVRRLAKGSGKSPFAAALALAELLAPVRFSHFDAKAIGRCVGKPVEMPLVQIAAVSQEQTANTMRMVRKMAAKGTKVQQKYGLDVGKMQIFAPQTHGELKIMTSSSTTAEGTQTTFFVADETEHWTSSQGGQELMKTLIQNAAKSGSRGIQTCNAWIPGIGSVAEDTEEAWLKQMELGEAYIGTKYLYDARIAPVDTDISDPTALRQALDFVYADCPWVPVDTILSYAFDPSYGESRFRRFYLNQPNAAENAWISAPEWAKLKDTTREVEVGEEIVLFFDGSKSKDATALVGCCVSDGHVFTLGVWYPPKDGEIDPYMIDSEIQRAFELYKPLAFFADVREWESFVKTDWPEKYKEQLMIWAIPGGISASPIAWDMRTKAYEFANEVEFTFNEILNEKFTHDGHPELTKHVLNARVKEYKGRATIYKESKASNKKIDAAICMVGARMAYRRLRESPDFENRGRKRRGLIW